MVNTIKMRLIKGFRYLFYHKAPHENIQKTFRANFVDLKEKTGTLIVNSSETERSKKTLVCIPYKWIVKVETLEDILTEDDVNVNLILPPDVLYTIDQYL